MLVVSRERQIYQDDLFSSFHRYVGPGDCLVLNDTRVFPARLHGRRNTPREPNLKCFLCER